MTALPGLPRRAHGPAESHLAAGRARAHPGTWRRPARSTGAVAHGPRPVQGGNDTLGHLSGDLLLQRVGPRFRAELLEMDLLVRLGGDEFAVLLPNADAQRACAVAERLLHVLEHPFALEGSEVEIGGSIGVALYPEHGTNADTLFRRADIAMYS